MRQRVARWLVGGALALALAYGLAISHVRTPVVHGAEPTPTPTSVHTDGNDPGSHPGGGGG